MIAKKLVDKSLITNQDLTFNQSIGLPIEVYCTKGAETLAFGQIETFNERNVVINGEPFCRQAHVFFGQRSLSA